MTLEQRKSSFVQLGKLMRALGESREWEGFSMGITEEEYMQLRESIELSGHHNPWFTPDHVSQSLRAIASWLDEQSLNEWLSNYPELANDRQERTIAIIMAGNIPLVGFHDALAALIAGHRVLAKLSSDDKLLLPALFKALHSFAPDLADRMRFTDGKMEGFEAVIATGSNNTSRYFEQYFGQYPHIIRRNRNSVAVLSGKESEDELKSLGNDIFSYFGLGCRNVTKLFIPADFELNRFFSAILPYAEVIHHHKYANNYDYHKALWLLNQDPLLDNGFLLLKEDEGLASPVGTLFYQRYSDQAEVREWIRSHASAIQCVVGDGGLPFGAAQQPGLMDYADDVDTLKFLLTLA